jgi:hydrogenase maturation protease
MHSAGCLPFIPPLSRAHFELQERERIAVLGLGNILLSDEGLGVHAAAALARYYTFSPPIDILDGGTLGLDLLPFFQARDRILIIDAVNFGKPPGYLAAFKGAEIPRVLTG